MLERLRNLREDKNLSQEDIARLINCTQTTYSKYELNKLEISISALITLSQFYNTSVDYLLGLTDVFMPYERSRL